MYPLPSENNEGDGELPPCETSFCCKLKRRPLKIEQPSFFTSVSQNNCNCNDSKKTKEPTTVETIYAGRSSVWNLSHPITDYDKILIMFDPVLDLGEPTVTYFEPYGSIVLDSWHLKMMLLPKITMIDIPSIGSITLHGEANDNPSTVSKIIVDWNGEPKFIRIFGLNFSD